MRKLIVAIAIGLTAVVGVWFALGANADARRPSTRPAHTRVQVATVTQAQHHAAPAVKSGSKSGNADENQASGDNESENGADTEIESENGGDNETDGYEDPDGVDVNHECPPDCGPGETG